MRTVTHTGFYFCTGPVYPTARAVSSCVDRRSSVSRSGGYVMDRTTAAMGQTKTGRDTRVDPVPPIIVVRLGCSRYVFLSPPPEGL